MSLFHWVCKECAIKIHRHKNQKFGMESRIKFPCAVCTIDSICVSLTLEQVKQIRKIN